MINPRGILVVALVTIGFICAGLAQQPARFNTSGPSVAKVLKTSHNHPPQDVALHDRFYSSWMMPDARHVSCCHERDCYPVEARHDRTGWLAKRREDGKWLRVPAAKVETERDNPDGRSHLCAPTPDMATTSEVFCFIAGSGT